MYFLQYQLRLRPFVSHRITSSVVSLSRGATRLNSKVLKDDNDLGPLGPYNLPYPWLSTNPTMTVFPTGVCPQADAPLLDATDPESAEMPTVAKVNGTQAPEPDSEEVDSMPPSLEEFIPGERLPDIIDVYVNEEFLFGTSERSEVLKRLTMQPIKYVRQYPPRTIDNKGMYNTLS
ncbi:hypothetical protein BGY98DRAFT_102296 [Russula aff. rugulosa BPL654]|nr:hypothetical protein BGY98DRAFT_102296 [Russula aff. rugulosa BPL654]